MSISSKERVEDRMSDSLKLNYIRVDRTDAIDNLTREVSDLQETIKAQNSRIALLETSLSQTGVSPSQSSSSITDFTATISKANGNSVKKKSPSEVCCGNRQVNKCPPHKPSCVRMENGQVYLPIRSEVTYKRSRVTEERRCLRVVEVASSDSNPCTPSRVWTENKLTKLKKNYAQSFTVHGLSRVFTGGALEQLVWGLLLLAAVAYCVYLLLQLYVRYKKFEVYTKVDFKHAEAMKLPSVTLCSKHFMSFCSVYPLFPEELCRKYYGMFNVTSCFVGKLSIGRFSCLTETYWFERHGCITFNPSGNLRQVSAGIDFGVHVEITFNKPGLASLTIHDNSVPFESEGYGQFEVGGGSMLDIQVEMQKIFRLPSPYPSKCTDGKHKHNFFKSKVYSIGSCRRKCRFLSFLKECGALFSQSMHGIPKEIVDLYPRKVSIGEYKQCWFNTVAKSFKETVDCHCPPPCKEVQYKYILSQSVSMEEEDKNKLKFALYYNSLQYTLWKERPAFSIESMFAEFGGLVGLLIGASLLSIFEVLIYFVLSVMQSLYRCYRV